MSDSEALEVCALHLSHRTLGNSGAGNKWLISPPKPSAKQGNTGIELTTCHLQRDTPASLSQQIDTNKRKSVKINQEAASVASLEKATRESTSALL